jgi:hypothetical protein
VSEKPTDRQTTIRVRIPLAVDCDGKWWTYGWHSAKKGDAESVICDMAEDFNHDTLTWKWLEADIEVPQQQVVKAKASDAK